MRLRAADGSAVHLSYCSNVHPAESAAEVVASLSTHAGPVRRQLGWPLLGVGLWLSAQAAGELDADPALLEHLRRTLHREGLEVVTLNGFPYGGFHAPVVKHAVYRPDWTSVERADHTVRLARLLAQLLPEDVVEGTISTLPLAHRSGWDEGRTRACLRRLDEVATALADLEQRTGRRIVLALEAEPGCVLETSEQVATLLRRLDRSHVRACLDAAHVAVQFEEPVDAVATLAEVGIAKAQLSVALQADVARDGALLRAHDEPRFLHQVREHTATGPLGVDDLPEALAGALPGSGAWRVHTHLPLHGDPRWTTAGVLRETLAALLGGPTPLTHCLEVETYTWSVLPHGHPGGVLPTRGPLDARGLVLGLAAELQWAHDELLALGLVELAPADADLARVAL